MRKHWKTTLSGIFTIAGGIVHYILTKDVTAAATAIASGIGLIKAKDSDK